VFIFALLFLELKQIVENRNLKLGDQVEDLLPTFIIAFLYIKRTENQFQFHLISLDLTPLPDNATSMKNVQSTVVSKTICTFLQN